MRTDEIGEIQSSAVENLTQLQELKALRNRSQNASNLLQRKITIPQQVNIEKQAPPPFTEEDRLEILNTLYRLNPLKQLNQVLGNCDFYLSQDDGDVVCMRVNHRLNFIGNKLNTNSIFKFDRKSYKLLSIESESPEHILVERYIVSDYLEVNNVQTIYFAQSPIGDKEVPIALKGKIMSTSLSGKNFPCDRLYFFEYDEAHPIMFKGQDVFWINGRLEIQNFSDYDKHNNIYKYHTQAKKSEMDLLDQGVEINNILTQLGLDFSISDLALSNRTRNSIEIRLKGDLVIDEVTIPAGAFLRINFNDLQFLEIVFHDSDTKFNKVMLKKIQLINPRLIKLKRSNFAVHFDSITGGMLRASSMNGYESTKIVKSQNGFMGIDDNGNIFEVNSSDKAGSIVRVPAGISNFIAQTFINPGLVNITRSDDVYRTFEIAGMEPDEGTEFLYQPNIDVNFSYNSRINKLVNDFAVPNVNNAYVSDDFEWIILATDGNPYDTLINGVAFEGVRSTLINTLTGDVYYKSSFVCLPHGKVFSYNPEAFVKVTDYGVIEEIGTVKQPRIEQLDEQENEKYRQSVRKKLNVLTIPQVYSTHFDTRVTIDEEINLGLSEYNGSRQINLKVPYSSVAVCDGYLRIVHLEPLQHQNQGIVTYDDYLYIEGIDSISFETENQTSPPKVKNLTGFITMKIGDQIIRTNNIYLKGSSLFFDYLGTTIEISIGDILNKKVKLPTSKIEYLADNKSINIPSKLDLLELSKILISNSANKTTEIYPGIDIAHYSQDIISTVRWSYENANNLYNGITLDEWSKFYRPYFYYRYSNPEKLFSEIKKYSEKNSFDYSDIIDLFFLYKVYVEIYSSSNEEIERLLLDYLKSASPSLIRIYRNEILQIIASFKAEESIRDGAISNITQEQEENLFQMDINIPSRFQTIQGFKKENFVLENGKLVFKKQIEETSILEKLPNARELAISLERAESINEIIENGARVDMNVVGKVSKLVETILGIKIESPELAVNYIIFSVIINFAETTLKDLKNDRTELGKQKLSEALKVLEDKIARIRTTRNLEEELSTENLDSNIVRVLMHMVSGTLPKEYIVFTIITLITSGISISEISNVLQLDNIISKERDGGIGIPYLILRQNILNAKEKGEQEYKKEIISSVNMLINYLRNYHNYKDFSQDFLIMSRLLNEEKEFTTNCFGIGLIFLSILDLMIGDICEISYATLHHHFNSDLNEWFETIGTINLDGHATFFVSLPTIEGEEQEYIIGDPLSVITRVDKGRLDPRPINCLIVKESDLVLSEAQNNLLQDTKMVSVNTESQITAIRMSGYETKIKSQKNDIFQIYKDKTQILLNAVLTSTDDMDEYLSVLTPDNHGSIIRQILNEDFKGDRITLFNKYMLLYSRHIGLTSSINNINSSISNNVELINFSISNKLWIEALFISNVNSVLLDRKSKQTQNYKEDALGSQKQSIYILSQIAKLSKEEINSLIESNSHLLRKEDIDRIWLSYNFIQIQNKVKTNQQLTTPELEFLSSRNGSECLNEEMRYENQQEMQKYFVKLLRFALTNKYIILALHLLDKIAVDNVNLSSKLNELKEKCIVFIARNRVHRNLVYKYVHLLSQNIREQIDNNKSFWRSSDSIEDLLLFYELEIDLTEVKADTTSSEVKILTISASVIENSGDRYLNEEEQRIKKSIEDETAAVELIAKEIENEINQNGSTYQALHEDDSDKDNPNLIQLPNNTSDTALEVLIAKYGEVRALNMLAIFFYKLEDTKVMAKLTATLERKNLVLPSPEEAVSTLGLTEERPLLSA